MTARTVFFMALLPCLLAACAQEDLEAPLLMPIPDNSIHYRARDYFDPGCEVADDRDCLLSADVLTTGFVDKLRYGTYQIQYSATDQSGNTGYAYRDVNIVLPIADYYDQTWKAYDTCTTGNYFYDGLIQDCDCGLSSVTVGNISNFGLSASFTLPVSGTYNHMLSLDTVKAGVTFFGTGMMSPKADSIYWNYVIIDSVQTDVCRSVWIK